MVVWWGRGCGMPDASGCCRFAQLSRSLPLKWRERSPPPHTPLSHTNSPHPPRADTPQGRQAPDLPSARLRVAWSPFFIMRTVMKMLLQPGLLVVVVLLALARTQALKPIPQKNVKAPPTARRADVTHRLNVLDMMIAVRTRLLVLWLVKSRVGKAGATAEKLTPLFSIFSPPCAGRGCHGHGGPGDASH